MGIIENRRKVASHVMGPAFMLFVVFSIIRGMTITPYADIAMVLLGVFVSPFAVYLCWRIFGWEMSLTEKLQLSMPAALYTVFMLCFYAGIGISVLVYTNFLKKAPGPIAAITMQITLTAPPEFEFRGKDRDYGDVVLANAEYPDFEFTLANRRKHKSEFQSILDDLKEGFVVEVKLKKSDYEMKLAKTVEPDFFTKYFSYHHITLYGLEYNKQQYVNVAIEETSSSAKQLWIFNGIVFSLFIALPLALLFWLRKRWVDRRYYRRKQKCPDQ